MHSSISSSPHTIETSRLTNYAAFILTKHGFAPRSVQANGNAHFERPNSHWAVNMLVDGGRVFIEQACISVITIGGTFIEEFLRTGLFTLDTREGKCVIVSM